MNKNADKGHNNVTEPRQFCNTRSHRSESYLGEIGQGPFHNSLSQICLWANFFEVTGVTQGINLVLQLCTWAEIWLAILLAMLEVYHFSVVSSEELPRQPIAFPLWAALVFPTLSSHLFLNYCVNSWTILFVNYHVLWKYLLFCFVCLPATIFGNLSRISNMSKLGMALAQWEKLKFGVPGCAWTAGTAESW